MLSYGVMNMFLNCLLGIFLLFSCVCALFTGRGAALSAAVSEGAQAGITLTISMAGAMCLWTGVGKLMERVGITAFLSKLLAPLLCRLFPASKHDEPLAAALSGNICANFLGLGNAATPMGIQAAQHMAKYTPSGIASDQLCRLVVLNTASIQLLPTTVAAIRTSLGCETPFDILPAVWITSFVSAVLGVTAAWLLGKVWPHA